MRRYLHDFDSVGVEVDLFNQVYGPNPVRLRWEGSRWESVRHWWNWHIAHPLFCSANGCYGHKDPGRWVPDE